MVLLKLILALSLVFSSLFSIAECCIRLVTDTSANENVFTSTSSSIINSTDVTNLNPSNCGQRPFSSPNKIVGGTQATVGDWGWQVLMLSNGDFSCGGSLINSQWVVTAAHCAEGVTTSTVSFRLGVNDRSSPESWSTIRSVSKMFIHPSYDTNTTVNDITLFKLSTPITYSNYIVPVCVPSESASFAGATSWATGWGSIFSNGPVSRYLMQVSMPFLTDARCKEKYPETKALSQVCAGETGQNKDTCQGDSGGPLVVEKADGRWYLAGITSYGEGCADGGVYTRTSYFYDWIMSIITNN